ncbi:hypothetical protein HOLleu_36025 [Holothuria leucospilota]|uniref:Uncharacterized protein n=1 Tax=Holothuria leucospilota TaxID=206669 RepID=A0A9Q1BDC8_HOLLE|nr:hypothetical protein HOLleu_36025 [Holothuria leucospilota]
MSSVSILLLLICAWIGKSRVVSYVTVCNGKLGEGKNDSECHIVLYQPVCLICPIAGSAQRVGWYYKDTQIAIDELNLASNHAGGLVVNEDCASTGYLYNGVVF